MPGGPGGSGGPGGPGGPGIDACACAAAYAKAEFKAVLD